MGRAEYFDPISQSRKPIKSGSIVSNTGLEYTPEDLKAIDDKIGILNGVGEAKEKANKADLESHKAESATIKHKAKEIGLQDTSNNFTAINLEGAMGELFTNVSNGKQLIATAITGKGQAASGSDTFLALSNKIKNINTGKKFASGTKMSEYGYTFKRMDGENHHMSKVEVTGLSFNPTLILLENNLGLAITVYDSRFPIDNRIHLMQYMNREIIGEHFRDVSPVQTKNGFTLPSRIRNGIVSWVAYE